MAAIWGGGGLAANYAWEMLHMRFYAAGFHALAAGKWSYDDRMPRVPFLGIGWSPILHQE